MSVIVSTLTIERLTASMAPAHPPAVMCVAKGTGFLSERLDMLLTDNEVDTNAIMRVRAGAAIHYADLAGAQAHICAHTRAP